MTDVAEAPTAQRLESLDFIRRCALFGILLTNINGMGLGPAGGSSASMIRRRPRAA